MMGVHLTTGSRLLYPTIVPTPFMPDSAHMLQQASQHQCYACLHMYMCTHTHRGERESAGLIHTRLWYPEVILGCHFSGIIHLVFER